MKCKAVRSVVLAVAIGTLGLSLAASAATYYVDAANGNDVNSGLSPTTAFRTIQRAANIMTAGDMCRVGPGNYYERVSVPRSGTANAPIVFVATGDVLTYGFLLSRVDYIIIEGFRVTTPMTQEYDAWNMSGIALVNTRYCEVRNNKISRTVREGIMVIATGTADSFSSSYNVVAGNKIEFAGTYAGITLSGAANLVEDNDISRTIQHPLYPILSTASGPDADGIKFSGRDHIIRGNYIHNISKDDPGNLTPHIDAFQTFGPAYNIILENNEVYLTAHGTQAAMIEQIRQPVRDITLRNNVVTSFRGFNVWGYDAWTGTVVPLPRVNILNNTFYGVRDYDIELHDCPDSVVKNNVISSTGRYIWTNSSLDIGNNAVPGTLRLHGNDLRISDPMFTDPANRNFRPREGSPLIDAGVVVGITYDFDATPVPQGNAPDIGAFEFGDAPTYRPTITLIGEETVMMRVGELYIDAGATADDAYGKDITAWVEVSSNVDTSAPGTYTVTYNVVDSYGSYAVPVVRTVIVQEVPNTPPVITLIGPASVTVELGEQYHDAGATAYDAEDGDLTAYITVTSNVDTRVAGIYQVVYNVTDSGGLAAQPVTRTVTVIETETTPPVITLIGTASVTVELGEPYHDAGATAYDDVDGDLTAYITVSSNVDTSVAGMYEVVYNVTNSGGLAAQPVTRTVTVTETEATPPLITLIGDSRLKIRRGVRYVDPGATAYDEVDGDITHHIVTTGDVNPRERGFYTITYNVTNSAGIAAETVSRTVHVIGN